MKAVNLIRAIGNLFGFHIANKPPVKNNQPSVRPLLRKYVPIGVNGDMGPTQMILCGGNPIPYKFTNQRQRRKLASQTR